MKTLNWITWGSLTLGFFFGIIWILLNFVGVFYGITSDAAWYEQSVPNWFIQVYTLFAFIAGFFLVIFVIFVRILDKEEMRKGI